MRKFTLTVLLFYSCFANAQKIYNNWYFGDSAGVTFNTNPPTALTGGQTKALEGTVSISDSLGNLLFYSEGITVWNRNHQIMPHGTGLSASLSTTQSTLIVPTPGSTTKYYLFTLDDASVISSGELKYSIVDMSLDNGLGDVDPYQKNVAVTSDLTEKLVSALSDSCNVWVITHLRNNDVFTARLITRNGIGPPVVTRAGSVHSSDPPNGSTGLTGAMKVSRNNKKIAVTNLHRVLELLDFDPATGIVSNAIALPMTPPHLGFGVCFSPDNTKLYITEANSDSQSFEIFQFDLSSNNATTIINSKKLVGQVLNSRYWVADLQIGPDDRIYFAQPEKSFLGVIPNPNLVAPQCGFDLQGVNLGTGKSMSCLPNEIRTSEDFIVFKLANDTTICEGEVLDLAAPNAKIYHWSTGETTQNIQISAAGKYWVDVSNGYCISSDTINISVSPKQFSIGNDTVLCKDKILLLDAGIAHSYQWSTGATTQTIQVTTSGLYWIRAQEGTCYRTDTINVYYTPMNECDCILYMPNAFTPNNDGLNDVFKALRKGGCEFLRFIIYDRWGKKVFETTDLNKGWDGRLAGKLQDNGVFVWQVIASKDGGSKIMKGTVTLIK
jgi:gliding motility-associated-like protein